MRCFITSPSFFPMVTPWYLLVSRLLALIKSGSVIKFALLSKVQHLKKSPFRKSLQPVVNQTRSADRLASSMFNKKPTTLNCIIHLLPQRPYCGIFLVCNLPSDTVRFSIWTRVWFRFARLYPITCFHNLVYNFVESIVQYVQACDGFNSLRCTTRMLHVWAFRFAHVTRSLGINIIEIISNVIDDFFGQFL